LYQGVTNRSKLEVAKEICIKEGTTLNEVAYIGDDINCKELLEAVGVKACPKDASKSIKNMMNIIELQKNGGSGAVREFIDYILKVTVQ